MRVEVKVCGITRMDDVRACEDAGVDAIGLNFWPGTPRCVSLEFAREVVASTKLEVVGVFVDASLETLQIARERTGITWLQLHGDEPLHLLQSVLPHAYKAVGVTGAGSLEHARRFAGARLLLDSRVPGGMPGGTGHAFDWALAVELAKERELTLAGGLHPGNVAEAIAQVRPSRVDVASGVETSPGVKSAEAIRRFVLAARAAGVTSEDAL